MVPRLVAQPYLAKGLRVWMIRGGVFAMAVDDLTRRHSFDVGGEE
jgi:hypothetical protein